MMTTFEPRTIRDVMKGLPNVKSSKLPMPEYINAFDERYYGVGGIFFAVESMKRHMTDEGWQIAKGMEHSGYHLAGHNLPINSTHIDTVLQQSDPEVVILQDKREWDVPSGNFREPNARFHQVTHLSNVHERFKLTVLKDAHQAPDYHRKSAQEIGCHAWLVYYHPDIVTKLAPYTRHQHLIRVYHTLDKNLVPDYQSDKRHGTLLSGAVSGAYPLRKRLVDNIGKLGSNTHYQKHPGYHRNGCCTPKFLEKLSFFKVSICTTSMYGYALRKIMESTACGCRVITDLPINDKLPFIDKNLIRVHPNIPIEEMRELIQETENSYNPSFQESVAAEAKGFYDFRAQGERTANDIEGLRKRYNNAH